MLVSPCKDCARRELGCHSTCKEYIQYQSDVKVYNKVIHDEKVRFAKTGNQLKLQRLKLLDRSH